MILRIAFRNMLRQKRRTALTLLTILGGFTLAAISIAWSDGTYSYIIKTFTQHRLGQIEVHRNGYLDRPSIDKRIRDYPSVGRRIQMAEGVEAWAPRVFCAGLASLGDKTAGVQLMGIDPGGRLPHPQGRVVYVSPPPPDPKKFLGGGMLKEIM